MPDSADLIDHLHAIRPPLATPWEMVGDAAAALALGLLAAILLGLLLRLATARRMRPGDQALRRLAAAETAPDDQRLVVFFETARSLASSLGYAGADWRRALDEKLKTDFFANGAADAAHANLYAPADAPHPAMLEREFARLIRKAGI